MIRIIEYTPQRFFAKKSRGAIRDLEHIFSDEGTFFIEHIETQRWLEEHTQMGPVLTNDPHKAMSFTTRGKASTFMIKNGYSSSKYHVTEHLFTDGSHDQL